MEQEHDDETKEDKTMAVSNAIVPMLSGEIAKIFMKNISEAKIKPYSPQKKDKTMYEIEKKLKERNGK